jgi:DNA-binding PadR family transcriptional regulator
MSLTEDAASLLPLTPAVLHILLALAGERLGKHGYAVAREVEQVTAGHIRMGPGTLYGSIQRMIDSDLIEEAPAARKPAKDDDERRRYYRLTPLGRRALELEAARLDAVVAIARSKQVLPAVGRA